MTRPLGQGHFLVEQVAQLQMCTRDSFPTTRQFAFLPRFSCRAQSLLLWPRAEPARRRPNRSPSRFFSFLEQCINSASLELWSGPRPKILWQLALAAL